MDYAAKMNRAAVKANQVIARIEGQEDSAEGNALYLGNPITANFGRPRTVEIPEPGGRYRRRMEMTVQVTRDQFATAPESKTKLIRLIPEREEYVIDVVGRHDPLYYDLTCVKIGT